MEPPLANIRINDLPSEATPTKTEVLAIDGATTRKTTIEAATLAGRPTASQAEAEAGVEPVKAMTPLTTAQAIAAQGSAQFASAAQGAKADTAVQPARAVNSGTGLTGGGNLSADRTIALNAGSIASLAKADTAVQPANTSTATFAFVLDEDNMASDSATKVPTQQSVKAYVDARITPPQGRLTLTSGAAIQTANAVAATTVYFTPYRGNSVPIWGSSAFVIRAFSELSLALSSNSGHTGYHQAGKIMDLGVFDDAGTLRLGTGVAWSGDNLIGTGAGSAERELLNGFWVNKNSMVCRFGSASGNTVTVPARGFTIVGSVMFTANGQTEFTLAPAGAAGGTPAKLMLSNIYNQVNMVAVENDTTVSYTKTTTTLEAFGVSTNNRIDFLNALADMTIGAEVTSTLITAVASATPYVAIGLDSTSVQSGVRALLSTTDTLTNVSVTASYYGVPSIGKHSVYALQGMLTTPQGNFSGSNFYALRASLMV